MKATIESTDKFEIKRLAKSDDMAFFIFELVNNAWRDFKHSDYDYEPYQNKILELLEEYHIDIEDLVE